LLVLELSLDNDGICLDVADPVAEKTAEVVETNDAFLDKQFAVLKKANVVFNLSPASEDRRRCTAGSGTS
jgi:hypothetical protein